MPHGICAKYGTDFNGPPGTSDAFAGANTAQAHSQPNRIFRNRHITDDAPVRLMNLPAMFSQPGESLFNSFFDDVALGIGFEALAEKNEEALSGTMGWVTPP